MMSHPVPEQALSKHVAILGKTGSGKSNLAKTVVEELLGRGERVCVIDPTGTWWGLRLQADGETPSPYSIVIFGGQHGDLPLAAAHGEHIARVIGTSSTSAIIDTRELTVSHRTRFFTGFAETLIRANQGELTLVLDESHLFMPQAGARVGGGAPAMLHAGNNLVSLGRGVGLRIVLISQRPAKLHKDSLTQVETLVAMRLLAPQDRKAIGEWIDEWAQGRDAGGLTASLPSLPTGQAWIWSPEINHLERAHCPLAATYDSGRVRAEGTPDLPPIDIAEIAKRLEVVGSELLAEDPKRLRRRIAELERELRERPAAAVDEAEVDRRVEAALAPIRDGHAALVALVDSAAFKMSEIGRDTRDVAERINSAWVELRDLAHRDPAPKPRQREDTPAPAPRPRRNGADQAARPAPPAPSRSTCTANGLTGPQQRILDALRWLSDLGITERASRVQVAFLAAYKPGGGAFNNTLGSLRSAGLITYPSSGEVALTEDGRAKAQPWGQPLTNEALHEAVMARLAGPQRRVLQPLIDAWPEGMDVRELARVAGYEAGGGSFNNTRGSLRSLGLIDYPAPGRAIALPVLFVEERRQP